MGFEEDVMDVLRKEVENAGGASALASACGLNLPTLTRWLSGDRQPKLKGLGLVMDYLGITISTKSPSSVAGATTCPELEAEVARLNAEVRRLELALAKSGGQVELLKEQLAEAQAGRQAETPAERKAAG